MKKMLTLLTVTMFAASLTGCGSCRRLCPCLDRGAYCGSPAPIYAPVAAMAPVSACQPYQYATQPYQYAAPLAATAPNQCCPAPAPQCCPAPTQCCSSWDPCQGVVNYSYPRAAPAACAAPACAAPTCAPACAPMAYAEPGCAYMEPGCGGPYMDGMSYGPVMTGGCATCGTGYSGTVVPSTDVMPTPVAD